MARDEAPREVSSAQEQIYKTFQGKESQESSSFPKVDKFYKLQREETRLYTAKNKDYAGVTSNPFGNFERVASLMKLYPNINFLTPSGVCIGYMLKHIDAVLFNLSERSAGAPHAPVTENCQDLAIYFKLLILLLEEEENANN